MSSLESTALSEARVTRPLRLGDLAVGHDNNLSLLRVVAATMVLFSHSFVLATGHGSAEPWLGRLGTTPGGLAVDIFFAVSGFLVTGSLQRSGSLRHFVAARGLRIYPALWVSLVLTAAVVGIWFTDLSVSQFLKSPQTWRWLGKNALMVTAEGPLPAAFLHVPFAGVVNGSLWTLRWELRCYLVLALIWWSLRRFNRGATVTFGRAIVVAALALSGINTMLHMTGRSLDYIQLAAMFFQGAALWILRERVPIGWISFSALAIVYLIAAVSSPLAFELVNGICLGWLVLHLAYLPGGILRGYNRFGDYSYGIYIFAFPIQQAILTLRPGLGVWALVAASALCTLALAVVSWHFVEEGALAHKDWLARRLRVC